MRDSMANDSWLAWLYLFVDDRIDAFQHGTVTSDLTEIEWPPY